MRGPRTQRGRLYLFFCFCFYLLPEHCMESKKRINEGRLPLACQLGVRGVREVFGFDI